MSNSRKITFYANNEDFGDKIPETYKILTSNDITTFSEEFIKLITTIWQISPSRISNFNILACVDNKNCSKTINDNSNSIQFSFIVSDNISDEDKKAGYGPNDYISAIDLGPWMAKVFNISKENIDTSVDAPKLTNSAFITAALEGRDPPEFPKLSPQPYGIKDEEAALSANEDTTPTTTLSANEDTTPTADTLLANEAELTPTADTLLANEAALSANEDTTPTATLAGNEDTTPTTTPENFTNISIPKLLQPFANVRPFSILLNKYKYSEYFNGATSEPVTTATPATTNTTGNKSPPPATSSPAPSSSSKSILDYVFEYSYLISFIGAIAFSISEVLGYNPIEMFSSKVLLAYYIFTTCCAIISLFAWFNTSLWFVDPNILNPLNVSTSNPWW